MPAIGMRLWAEERKAGTIELLMTLPLTTTQAVLGKFFAAWIFIFIALILIFPIWITVNYLGQPDNGVILAGQVGVSNKVKVGDKVIASSKTGIISNIEAGKVVSGFPAIPNKLWLRCSANFKKLPEIAKAIRQLDRRNSR